jgi:NB-ARC domain
MNFNQSLDFLDRLSIQQRGKRLEPIEREILSVAWEHGSYQQIKNFQEQTVKNKAVKLWKYLSELLSTKVRKYNLRDILEGLDLALIFSELSTEVVEIDRHRRSRFYGRLTELWQLQSWIESGQRQSISIYGMKGIGKTALVRRLAHNLAPKLDRIVWISLADAPPLIDVLELIIKELGGGRDAKLSKNLQIAIDKTIGYLQHNRCLLVFDDADPVLVQDDSSKSDLVRDYAQFFEQLNTGASDSHYLTISTEKCWIGLNDSLSLLRRQTLLLGQTLCYREREASPTETLRERQLELKGLDRQSCQDLLHTSELVGTITEWDTLIDRYQGHPQHLKIVANMISDIFTGKIEKFLEINLLVNPQIEILLDQQLDLLSNSEMSILLWLAIEGEPIDLAQIQLLTSVSISGRSTVKILDRLVRKYLVEIRGGLFTLPELIMKTVTARYYELVCEGITTKKLKILHLYPIVPLTNMLRIDRDCAGNNANKFHQDIKHHLQSIVTKLLSREHLTPPCSEILASILFPSLEQKMKLKQDLKARLSELLMQLYPLEYKYIYYPKTQLASRNRTQQAKMPSYAVENLTNLLNSIDLKLVS